MELLIILILTIIVLPFSGILTIEIIDDGFNDKPLVFISFLYTFLVLFLYTLLVFFLSISYINKPKAIDVYRNKTTLEITYKDRVPVDSTVVWKNR